MCEQSPDREVEGGEAAIKLVVPAALEAKIRLRARELRNQPTRSEGILWQAIRRRQLDGLRFRRQQPIGPFIIDFFAPSHRLVVEVDGPVHETQAEADRVRQEILEGLGLRVVRLPAELVEQDLEAALTIIREALSMDAGRASGK